MFDNSEVRELNIMTPALKKPGCMLTKIEKQQDNSIVFHFVEKATGATLQQREFAPKRRSTQQTNEEFEKDISLLTSRIAHIARAFLTEEEFKAIKVNIDPATKYTDAGVTKNWLEYIKLTAIALGANTPNPKFKDVECDLKVTYRFSKKDGKYYASLPVVPAFISTANHPKVFVENPTYDIFTIPSISPDTEKPNLDSTAETPTAEFSGGTVGSDGW